MTTTHDIPRTDLGPLTISGAASLPGIDAPRRGPVFGSQFAVASDHQLASQTAMRVLFSGGNAVDATIAASAVNAVVKPHYTALGGDAFTLIWRKNAGTVDCLNAGGRSPRRATLDQFNGKIPDLGALASTVPGLVDAWLEIHQTYATLPLDVLLAPAIRLAEEGFPTPMRLSEAMKIVANYKDPAAAALKQVFLKKGREPYAPGENLRQTDLAATLRAIVDEGREGFYAGRVAAAIAKGMADFGGLIDEGDLAEPTAHFHDPVMTTYGGCDVYEQAMPSQGIIMLMALNIVENFPISDWGLGSPDSLHVLVEATKLAFADSRRYVADPLVESVPVERLLSKEHARMRAAEIDLKRAKQPLAADIPGGDTTAFVVGDSDMAVAFIQSVFASWGSRFLIPGTGILMNNRLRGFSTDPENPNHLAPGKRAVHTLNTFLALRDGDLVVGGGTPGRDFQVQNNMQTLVGVLNWGLDIQNAVDMPRWTSLNDGQLAMEGRFPQSTMQDLQSRGHDVLHIAPFDAALSRSQMIASLPEGGWAVASDVRGEGVGLGS